MLVNFYFSLELNLQSSIVCLQINTKVYFAKMSDTTFLHSHNEFNLHSKVQAINKIASYINTRFDRFNLDLNLSQVIILLSKESVFISKFRSLHF